MNLAKTQEEQEKEKIAANIKAEVEYAKQVADQKKKMLEHYQRELPFLRKRAEFTRLMADIAEDTLRKQHSELQYAQLMKSQPSSEELYNAANKKKEAELKGEEQPAEKLELEEKGEIKIKTERTPHPEGNK